MMAAAVIKRLAFMRLPYHVGTALFASNVGIDLLGWTDSEFRPGSLILFVTPHRKLHIFPRRANFSGVSYQFIPRRPQREPPRPKPLPECA